MQTTSYAKAGLLVLVLVVCFLIGWETYLRRQGFLLSYNDDKELWAYTRQRVYEAQPANPVIIGSSRVKFGLALDTWKSITGAAPTQLAMVGTSPRPLLTDLARDNRFRGTVLVGVTEGLFFAPPGSPPEQQAHDNLAFYAKRSIAQQSGFAVNKVLETHLLFLDEDRFSLGGLLTQLPIANRPGVFALPAFPQRFAIDRFDRYTEMTPDFLADTAMQSRVRDIWHYINTQMPSQPMPDSVLTGIFKAVSADVARIQGRGGKVLFVRMPSSGWLREREKRTYPRAKYWDRLLRETGAPGIHYEDYPALARYSCPEWSHLSPADARTFTADFIQIMGHQPGWAVTPRTPAAPRPAVSTLTTR
jgi:hypothetical protein